MASREDTLRRVLAAVEALPTKRLSAGLMGDKGTEHCAVGCLIECEKPKQVGVSFAEMYDLHPSTVDAIIHYNDIYLRSCSEEARYEKMLRRLRDEILSLEVEQIFDRVYELCALDLPIKATDTFVHEVDKALSAGDIERVIALSDVNTNRVPADLLTTLLVLVTPAREKLGETYKHIKRRYFYALREQHRWDEDRIQRFEHRLK